MAWTERGYVSPPGWSKTVRRILARDPLCYLCRRAPATTVDHVVPVWRGGPHEDSNYAGVCKPCHAAKSAREAVEARAVKRVSAKRKPERHPGLL